MINCLAACADLTQAMIQRSILLARDAALVAQRCRLAMLSDTC